MNNRKKYDDIDNLFRCIARRKKKLTIKTSEDEEKKYQRRRRRKINEKSMEMPIKIR